MTREISDNPSGWSRSLPGHSIEYTPGFVTPFHYGVYHNVNAGSFYDYVLTFIDTEHIYFVDTVWISPQAITNCVATFYVGAVAYSVAAGVGYVYMNMRNNPSLFFVAGDSITVRATNLDSYLRNMYIGITGTCINKPANFGRSPIAKFSIDDHSINAGQSIVCTDGSTRSPVSWVWVWGDGTPDSITQNPTHTYNTPGSYFPKLKAINQYGFDYYAESTPVVVS